MKKLALAIVATAFVGFSHAPVNAQSSDPEPIEPIPADQALECAESEGRTDTNHDGIEDKCTDFYIDGHPTPPPGQVADTGSSGVSSMLGLGSALLVGGGIAVVSTRRRATASTTS